MIVKTDNLTSNIQILQYSVARSIIGDLCSGHIFITIRWLVSVDTVKITKYLCKDMHILF